VPAIHPVIRRLVRASIVLALAGFTAMAGEEVTGRRQAGRSLIEALHGVQAQGLRIIYSSDVVSEDMRVGEEPSATDPRAVLDQLLAPHGLEAIDGPGGTLLLVRKDPVTKVGSIVGTVRTRAEDRPVAAARVIVSGTGMRVITGEGGSFQVEGLSPGTYDLIVEVEGLRSERFDGVTVRADGPTDVTLRMAAVPKIVERVVVTPDRKLWADGQPDSGEVISSENLQATPAIGDDVQRALAVRPGVASADRSAEISIRGGEPNEVLVLFDGLELYDPFHLKGFQRFSGIIDTMTVGGAEYFAGPFPVEYGDRMSGVLDLYSSVPAESGQTSISSSFINSRFMTGGAFREGSGHWLVSAREWHPDAVVQTVDPEDEGLSPSYYDLLGKVQISAGQRSVLAANFLAARDGVDFTDPDGEESVDASSGTRYGWLTLKSLWSPRLYSRSLVSVGRLQSRRDGRIEEDNGLMASVRDGRAFDVLGFAQDWTYRPAERLLLKWGLGGKWLDADYSYVSRSTAPAGSSGGGAALAPSDRDVLLDPSGRQSGAYLSGQFMPARPLRLEIGFRWDRQSYTREGQLSPRLSLVHDLSTSSRIRAAWGRYYQSQGIHEVQIEDGVTGFYPAQLAEQWSIGLEHEFGNGLSLRADAYSKDMTHLRPRFENLFNPFELLPEFEPDRVRIAPDRATAKGIDLALTMERGGPFTWWAGYSRSSIVEDVDGRSVPRSWDQPHAFQFGLNVRKGDRWSLIFAGLYHTGWPTTSVGAVTVAGPHGTTTVEPVLGPRNGARYPDYQRLDLRASRHFRVGGGRLSVFAEITNLLGRDNVCCVEDVTFLPRADGTVRVEREDGLWLQRVPSLGIAWEFDH
jgi:TonB-dependent receptor-like protein/carboxypeptidase family protein